MAPVRVVVPEPAWVTPPAPAMTDVIRLVVVPFAVSIEPLLRERVPGPATVASVMLNAL